MTSEMLAEHNAVVSDKKFTYESEDSEEENDIEFPEDAVSEDSIDDTDVDPDFVPNTANIEENIVSTISKIYEKPATLFQSKLVQKK